MKIEAISPLLTTLILHYAYHCRAEVAVYGACFNPNPSEGENAYHCHFDSTECIEGEEWLNPMETKAKGYKCTCDADYNDNVYIAACYSMVTHQVSCAPDNSQCESSDMILGTRLNSDNIVSDECGPGDSPYDNGTVSCGKQCKCNFHYAQGAKVELETSLYGRCYKPNDKVNSYCAVKKATCSPGESYSGPYDKFADSRPKCTCEKTKTGACMKQNGDFSHCAIAADSCATDQTYLKVAELKAADYDIDCTLCEDSDAPSKCWNNRKFRMGGTKHQSCKWIGVKPSRRKNHCQRAYIKKQCPSTCGICCADDPDPFFKVLNGTKKGCNYLNKKKRIDTFCKKPLIKSSCPQKCNFCVETSDDDDD